MQWCTLLTCILFLHNKGNVWNGFKVVLLETCSYTQNGIQFVNSLLFVLFWFQWNEGRCLITMEDKQLAKTTTKTRIWGILLVQKWKIRRLNDGETPLASGRSGPSPGPRCVWCHATGSHQSDVKTVHRMESLTWRIPPAWDRCVKSCLHFNTALFRLPQASRTFTAVTNTSST